MHRSLRLAVASLLVLGAGSAAQATPLYLCQNSAYTAYYVMWGLISQPGSNVIDFHSGTTGGSHKIDELGFEYPIIAVVCSAQESSWLAQNQLMVDASPLGGETVGELFSVRDASDPNQPIVGTAWRDKFAPFDQGGSMGYQKYWSRTSGHWQLVYYWGWGWQWTWFPASNPVVQNVAMFSSGLDRGAINGTNQSIVDAAYFSPLSDLLNVALDEHIQWVENYPYQYTKQDFLGTFGANANSLVHYDLVDPSGGNPGMPGP